MSKKSSISIIGALLLSVSALQGATINNSDPIGFDSSSRGGASTTISNSNSVFNNPATLDSGKYFSETSINGRIGFQENGLLGNMSDLHDLALDDVFNTIEANYLSGNTTAIRNKITEAKNTITDMNGNNVLIKTGGNFGFNIGKFGIGVNTQAYAVGEMVVDQSRTDLIFNVGSGQYASYDPLTDTYIVSNLADYQNNSLEYAVNNGHTYANIKYSVLTEVPVSYAEDFQLPNADYVNVGATAKLMHLQSSSKQIKVNSDIDNITEDLSNNSGDDMSFGVDLGALYTFSKYDLSVGLVGKNLNSPTFDIKGVEYKINPSFKLGVSKGFFDNSLKFATDIDLSKNKSTFTNMSEQYIGLGLSYEPTSWLSLSGGVKKNISSWAKDTENDGFIYSAGFGVGFKWFQFGTSVELGSDTNEVEGNDIPKYANINFSLVGKFGTNGKKEAPDGLTSKERMAKFNK